MELLTQEEIQEWLVDIAQAESPKAQQALDKLRKTRDFIYATWLATLDEQISRLEALPKQMRGDLKELVLGHVEAGGASDIHPLVEFRRTDSFQYDKKDALSFVLENELPYTRTKVELDANAFKKACQSGDIDYPAGETVNTPTVAIGKLGHLLIITKD